MTTTINNSVQYMGNLEICGDLEVMGNLTIHGKTNKKLIDEKLRNLLISQNILTENQLNQYIDSINVMEKLTK